MSPEAPRGIAVADVGSTNTKLYLFAPDGQRVAERTVPSRHVEGPPYRWLDPEPALQFLARSLPELDQILPVDVVVPCAHGAALACLGTGGSLALPVMDYTAEPPAGIVAAYRQMMPGFAECYCPLLPMALIHALQLYWQQTGWPQQFAAVTTILPWSQYFGYRLSGSMATEITSLAFQSQLVNVAGGGFSSIAERMGWAPLFAPIRNAWEPLGALNPEFRGRLFRGRGLVLTGIHDSSANFLRYLAAGLREFTLLSTGTWSICFDTTSPVSALREELDTAVNINVFGTPVAISRFFGGKEFELIAGPGNQAAAELQLAEALVARRTLALPSFTASPGPMPGTALKGRIVGRGPATPAERSSLASLYCALMLSEQLDAIRSRNDIIVDGPFAANSALLAILAQLRGRQTVRASTLRDGTATGAACLALMPDGRLPQAPLELPEIVPSRIEDLEPYRVRWRELARGTAT